MRILASSPTHFASSQIRFLNILSRYWWLLALLSIALLLHSMRHAPALPLLLFASSLVGAVSYFVLLRLDLQVNRASIAFGFLIFLALWPLKHLSGALALGADMQLLLTLRYLACIFLVWGLAVPFTRRSLNRLISQKIEFLQHGEVEIPDYRPLRPTLDFARLRRYRNRQELEK